MHRFLGLLGMVPSKGSTSCMWFCFGVLPLLRGNVHLSHSPSLALSIAELHVPVPGPIHCLVFVSLETRRHLRHPLPHTLEEGKALRGLSPGHFFRVEVLSGAGEESISECWEPMNPQEKQRSRKQWIKLEGPNRWSFNPSSWKDQVGRFEMASENGGLLQK